MTEADSTKYQFKCQRMPKFSTAFRSLFGVFSSYPSASPLLRSCLLALVLTCNSGQILAATQSNNFSLPRSVLSASSGASQSSSFQIVVSVLGQSSAIGESQSTNFQNTGGYIYSARDGDDDGVPDSIDNCPLIPNPDQLDTDADDQGDVCDDDDDGDGIDDGDDNCPLISNDSQTNIDDDAFGDACDDDDDNDGLEDGDDNCQFDSNPDQTDTDGDLFGDACDTDDDDDGILDEDDNCPLTSNPGQEDDDNNGTGNDCELNDGDLCLPVKAQNGKIAVVCL